MPYLPTTFAQLDPDESDYATSRAVVLPLPFERTTSYGKGTVDGPDAILRASRALEVYDEELDREPCSRGIATLPPFLPEAHAMDDALREIHAEARSRSEGSTASPRPSRSPPGTPSATSWEWSSSTPTPICGRSTRGRPGATRR